MSLIITQVLSLIVVFLFLNHLLFVVGDHDGVYRGYRYFQWYVLRNIFLSIWS